MKNWITLSTGLFGLLVGCAHSINPPAAMRQPAVTHIHGYTREDDYAWLRNKDAPEVSRYITEENAYSDHVMAPLSPLIDQLQQEFLARIDENDQAVPHAVGPYLYYSRQVKGKQYSIQCRKKSWEAPEEIILDLNDLARTQEYVGLGAFAPSDSGRYIAYTIDSTGFREYKLHIRDMTAGRLLPDSAERVSSFTWTPDEKTVFYTTENDAHRSSRVWRLTLGNQPELVYEEKDEAFDVGVGMTRSRGFIVVNSESYGQSETQLIPANHPEAAPKVVCPRRADHEYSVDHRGNTLYILTNDRGRNFRLCEAPVDQPSPDHWTEILPHRDDVMLDSIEPFANDLVLMERAGGMTRLATLDPATHVEKPLNFPEPFYTLELGPNDVFNTAQLRVAYTSLLTPATVYDYNLESGQLTQLKRETVHGYDPARYEMKRLFATARDGTKVPISLVYRKDLPPGPRPMLLDGYGSYGLPEWPYFSSANLSLLDRGMIVGIAHIRGGGEMGKVWHDQGRLMNKRNTFNDFIDCAKYLKDEHYTSPDQLAITGASAGGMLMGAVLNERPELFKCALVGVPFVDVMNTMLDDSLPLTTQEYLEWGNPNEKPAYDYMSAYSPYDNIRRQDYPAMLVFTSMNDSQVMYWEPTKYVARLRTMKTDPHPLLLHVSTTGGHGGPSGRYNEYKELATQYAFVLWQLGLAK